MQRGDRMILTATLSSIAIIAITVFVVSFNSATGGVIDSRAFISSNENTACMRAYCTGYQEAYYLGQQGMYAECCCPEDYKGNGYCRQPLYLAP